nr:MAG TPA: hypothetical protein [Caudoviricetes sp.]
MRIGRRSHIVVFFLGNSRGGECYRLPVISYAFLLLGSL